MFRHFRASRKRDLERGSSSSSSSNNLLAVGDVDIRSVLPEEIHRKIFSHLPTADAARAGSSCRMWRNIWFSQSKLIFDYDLFPEIERKLGSFVRFIDKTITHHDESDVKEFGLSFWPEIDLEFRIKREWVVFARQHNVQRLVLYGKIDKARKVLNSVFSCESLVQLELGLKNLRLTLSETSTLPNLRKLKLKYLVLSDLSLRQDPFSSFPSLEKLSILFCDIINLKILSVSASKLKEFIMCCCRGMEYCPVSFQTPTLATFIYINTDATGVELTIPEHLFGLVLNAGDAYLKSESAYNRNRSILKVTRELFKTNKLMLNRCWLIEYISMVHDLPRQMAVDVFKNLILLEITIWPVVEHVRTLMLLISRCPCLVELYLAIMESEREIRELHGVDDHFIDFDDENSFHSLSYIKINNFGGDNIEMLLVRLLLANARELDLMRIVMNMFMVINYMDKKINTILEYEKASAFADVIFD